MYGCHMKNKETDLKSIFGKMMWVKNINFKLVNIS